MEERYGDMQGQELRFGAVTFQKKVRAPSWESIYYGSYDVRLSDIYGQMSKASNE